VVQVLFDKGDYRQLTATMCNDFLTISMLILIYYAYHSSAFKMSLSEQTMTVGETYEFSLKYDKPIGARFDVYTMENLDNPALKSSKIGFPAFNTTTVYSPHYFRTNQYISLQSKHEIENEAVEVTLANKEIQVGDEGVLNHSTIYFVLKSVSSSSIKVVILPVKINRAQVESCILQENKYIETKKHEKLVSSFSVANVPGCNRDIEHFSVMIDIDQYILVDEVITSIDNNVLRYYVNGSRMYFKMSVVPIFTVFEVIIFFKPKNEFLISGSKYIKNILYYSWVEWNEDNRVWRKTIEYESCFLHDKRESRAGNSFKIYNLDNGACIKQLMNEFYESQDNDCPSYLNLPFNIKHECGSCMEVVKTTNAMKVKANNCNYLNYEKAKGIIVSDTHIRGYNEGNVTGFKGLRTPSPNLVSDKGYNRYERVYDDSYGISYGTVVEELKNENENCKLVTFIYIGPGTIVCTHQCIRKQIQCMVKVSNVVTVIAIPTNAKSLLGYDPVLFCLYGKTTNGLVFMFNIKTRKTIIIKEKVLESIMPTLIKSQVVDRDSVHERRYNTSSTTTTVSPFGMFNEGKKKHYVLFPAYQNHDKVSQTFEMAMKSCKEINFYNKNILSGEFHIKSADIEDYHGRVYCDKGWTLVFDYYHNYTDTATFPTANIFDIALSNYTKCPNPVALYKLYTNIKFNKFRFFCEALEPKYTKVEIETLALEDGNSALFSYFINKGTSVTNTCWQYKLGDDHTSDLGRDCNNFQVGVSEYFLRRILRDVFKQNELRLSIDSTKSCGEGTYHGHWTVHVI